jgi:hypothetical protein
MSDLIVLAIVMFALHKLPDGEMKQYDRGRIAENDVVVCAERCNHYRNNEAVPKNNIIIYPDAGPGEPEYGRHRKVDRHSH